MQQTTRKIIHVDMDAFFAAVEQRDNQHWRAKPVIVGGMPNSRGVVAACSYEARQFGIHSAMPSAEAARRCPQGIFVAPRFDAYKAVSQQVHAIFRHYTDLVEPLSMDEAFLDVTASERHGGSATLLATEIRRHIRRATRLTASAGISYNKFLAKVACDVNKPDGQFTITPDQARDWLSKLPISKFYGVGRVTEARMKQAGIHSGAHVLAAGKDKLVKLFGRMGAYYYTIACGIDESPVSPVRERKSISVENTFPQDLADTAEMLTHLNAMADKLCRVLRDKDLQARTMSIKVKYPDFQVGTRAHTFSTPTDDASTLREHVPALLAKTDAERRSVRLLGLRVANLTPINVPRQMELTAT